MSNFKNATFLLGTGIAAGALGYMAGRRRLLENPSQQDLRTYKRFRDELGASSQDAWEAIQGLREIRERGWDYTWRDAFDEDGEKINEVLLVDGEGTEIERGWDHTFTAVGQDYVAGSLAFHEAGRIEALPPDPRAPNPTGFPLSAKPLKTGKHEGKVMYRPKVRGKKGRPRSYLPPEQADALETDTRSVVRKRQKRGRKENPGPTNTAALMQSLKF